MIWINDSLLLIEPLRTNLSEIGIEYDKTRLKINIVWNMAAILCRPQCVNWTRKWVFEPQYQSTKVGYPESV